MSAGRRLAQYANWLIPLAYSLAAIAAGLTFSRLERRYIPELLASGISVPSAMAIYGAIASGMIALTGIVFSLNYLMIQFSATAYSPRVVLWKARDPVLAHALGTFTATFLYAIAALAWIDRGGAKVPILSASVVDFLLLASVIMFISLVQRVGALQIDRMLQFIGKKGREAISNLYPPPKSCAITQRVEQYRRWPASQILFHHGAPIVIQAVKIAKLIKLAKRCGGVIAFDAVVGDTITEFTPLLRIYGAHHPVKERGLRAAVLLGIDRTFEQDPKYAIRLLVDIAIRALSAAINDPTTAVQALDQIEDLLFRLGRCHLEIGAFHDVEGNLRVIVPFPTWADFLRLALDEIRYYGASSVQVARRLNALIANLAAVLPEERRPELLYWKERIRGTISRSFHDVEEQAEASAEDRQGLGVPRRRDTA